MSAPRLVSVEVCDIDADGMGIGTFGDRQVHVKGVAPAPTGAPTVVPARVVKRRRGHWFALPEADATTDRAAPCPAFPRCGGCVQQHLAASDQLARKERQVVARLATFGVVPDVVAAPCHGPQFHYRRRARLGVRHLGREDETLVGFRESFGSRVARLDGCLILTEPLARAFPLLRTTLAALDGRARIPQVELAAGDTAGAMIVRHLDALSSADRHRLDGLARATGLHVLSQPGGYDSVVSLDGGELPWLNYRLDEFGLAFEFAPTDFVQVNPVINRHLVAAAVTLLEPRPGRRVVDLFCGIGNFTLPLARRGAAVTGVEASATLVAAARRNAGHNGVEGSTEFLEADLYEDLGRALEPVLQQADAVLIDPPRSGLGGGLSDLLVASDVGRIVYVSCHPESFARDAGTLAAGGYQLHRLSVFDMFPHTTHVETLALFERR